MAIAFGASIVSCSTDVDGTSIVPVFDKIICSPEHPAPGDSVTVTGHQVVMGKLVNATTYNWDFTYTRAETNRDTTITRSTHVVYDAEGGSADPVMGFRIPADSPGRYLKVSLHATYSLSGQTAEGAIYGEATRSTTITLQ